MEGGLGGDAVLAGSVVEVDLTFDGEEDISF